MIYGSMYLFLTGTLINHLSSIFQKEQKQSGFQPKPKENQRKTTADNG